MKSLRDATMDGYRITRFKRAMTLLILLLVVVAACKINVGRFEKYRNRRDSEKMFIEWMLDREATPEVRAKAIEMLFEQFNQEGWRYLPRVGDLPAEQRHQAIRDALPRIKALYASNRPCRSEADCGGYGQCQVTEVGSCGVSGTNCTTSADCDGQECIMTRCLGAQFNLGTETLFRLLPVRVRDGVIMLLEVTEDQQTRENLLELVHQWTQDHYDPCVTSIGRHPASRILSMVGAERGLPIVTQYIRSGSFNDMLCQNSFIHEISWLAQNADNVSAAYIDRWEQSRPEDIQAQFDFVECMVRVPESQLLKSWIFQQLTSTDSHLMENFVDAFLVYVSPLAQPSDAQHYARMVQLYHGNLRWIGFESLVSLAGAEGLVSALNAIPFDPPPPDPADEEAMAAYVPIPWGLWGHRQLYDGLQRAADHLCTRQEITADPDAMRPALTSQLNHENVVAQAIAIRCLAEVGDESSTAHIQALQDNTSIVPAWGDDEEDYTIRAVAIDSLERLQARLSGDDSTLEASEEAEE